MTELPAYMAGLFVMLALVGLTIWRHHEQTLPPALRAGLAALWRHQLLRTAFVIACNWNLGVIYVSATGNETPYVFSFVIDTLSAFVVIWRPAGKVQAYIGLFYLFQIAGHVVYGARDLLGKPASPVLYYDTLTWVAWLQLLAMGAWCGGIWIGVLVRYLRDRRHAADSGASAANPVEKP